MFFICKGVEATGIKHLRISSALCSPLAISFRSRETRDPDPWRGSCWHCWPWWRSGKEWYEAWFFRRVNASILSFDAQSGILESRKMYVSLYAPFFSMVLSPAAGLRRHSFQQLQAWHTTRWLQVHSHHHEHHNHAERRCLTAKNMKHAVPIELTILLGNGMRWNAHISTPMGMFCMPLWCICLLYPLAGSCSRRFMQVCSMSLQYFGAKIQTMGHFYMDEPYMTDTPEFWHQDGMGAMTAALLGLAAVVCKARSHDNFCRIVLISLQANSDKHCKILHWITGVCTQNVVRCFASEHPQRKWILPQKFEKIMQHRQKSKTLSASSMYHQILYAIARLAWFSLYLNSQTPENPMRYCKS